jgi:hypothetical protein
MRVIQLHRYEARPFAGLRLPASMIGALLLAMGLGDRLDLTGALVAEARAAPAASSPAQAAPAPAGPAILAAWTQLVPDPAGCAAGAPTCAAILLRIVVPPGAGCDGLAADATTGAAIALRQRRNPWQAQFPIVVCEEVLKLQGPDVRLADGAVLSWRHLADAAPQKISIIGDTGCQPPRQNCNRPDSWPLARVAEAAAWLDEGQPDLVIHVGDYRYRGTDRWEDWRDDVFAPMRPLLLAAPWVVTRGNHENCFRDDASGTETGYGWSLLLSPSPDPLPCDFHAARVEATASVDLRGLRLVTIDAADSYYRCQSWQGGFQKTQRKKLAQLLGPAGGRDVWLLSHYAIFNFQQSGDCGSASSHSGKPLHDLVAPLVTASGVKVVLSGDQHRFAIVQVQGPAPAGGGAPLAITQIIAGHGGTLLDPASPGTDESGSAAALPGLSCRMDIGASGGYPPGLTAEARLRHVFGFMAAIRTQAGWDFDLRTVAAAAEQNEEPCPVPGAAGTCVTPLPASPPPCPG